MLKRRYLIYLICWTLFISYELSLVYYSTGRLDRPYIYIFYYAINISFFYLVNQIINFTFGQEKPKLLHGLLRYVLLFLLFLYLKGFIDFLLADDPWGKFSVSINTYTFSLRNIFRNIYFTVLATFYWEAGNISLFRRKTFEAESRQLALTYEKADLETQLTKIHSAYLQQQINPHLLFNALNFVYARVQEHSEEAAHCVWLLAEIMHFSLRESGADGKIDLADEIEQIRHLTEINAYRYPVDPILSLKGEFSEARIIPLILLTLTENIFKHGDLTNPHEPAYLRIEIDGQRKLIFYSRNLKKAKSTQFFRPQLGLHNVRIRLDAAYPNQYHLIIEEPENSFELTLTINL